MPIIVCTSNINLTETNLSALVRRLTAEISHILEKPADDVMILWNTGFTFMGGADASCLFVDIKTFSELNVTICADICRLIVTSIQHVHLIDEAHCYINFHEVHATAGWRFVGSRPVCPATASLENPHG